MSDSHFYETYNSGKYTIREWSDGTIEYMVDGKLHREDGPAIEHADGDMRWYQHGQRHRVNGPAIEHVGGNRKWYQNDKLHRIDGPAIEFSSGGTFWYYKGEYVECTSQEEFERLIKLKAFW